MECDLSDVPIRYLDVSCSPLDVELNEPSYPFPAFAAVSFRTSSESCAAAWRRLDQETEDTPRRIAWSNPAWQETVTALGPIASIVLRGLLDWVTHPDSADTFMLDIDLGRKLLLAKTLMPPGTPTTYVLWVVTSVRMGQTGPIPPSLFAGGQSEASPEPACSSNKRRRSPSSEYESASTLPTDCKYLLDHADWSKTSLGPRSTWSPVIEMMINLIMSSKTQDALWLGKDLNLI